jgi:hypothetical protein
MFNEHILVVRMNFVFRNIQEVWRSGNIALPFLTSALDGGQWSSPHPNLSTPREWALGAHCIRGRVSPGQEVLGTNRLLSFDTTTDNTESELSNNSPIVACVFVVAVTFLLSRCLATAGDTQTDTQIDGEGDLQNTPMKRS